MAAFAMLPAAHPSTALLHRSTLTPRVFQAEHLGLILIREDFRVTPPIHHRIERFLGRSVAQMVLQLLLETHARRAMAGALVEHALDVLGQRYGSEEVVGEISLRVWVSSSAKFRAAALSTISPSLVSAKPR